MIERCTEQARRTLFFARYEAFQSGSSFIETEHVLLGLFRDDQSLAARVLAEARLSSDGIRREIEAHTARRTPLPSSSDDLPFSEDATRVLQYAAQEGERLLHRSIGTEHLLLGLFREERGLAASILHGHGLRLAQVRDQIVMMSSAAARLPVGFPFDLPARTGAPRPFQISPSERSPTDGPLTTTSPQRVTAEGLTLTELIAWAYRADTRHVEVPADFDDRVRYDVRLDLPGERSWPAIDRLIQEGLNAHFAITVARETRSLDAYVLTATDGPCPGRRRQGEEDPGFAASYTGFSTFDDAASEPVPLGGPGWRSRLHSVGPILLTATTMAEFGRWLEDFVGHPVVDETRLAGTYDIEMQGEMQGLEELRLALQAQLALTLTHEKRDTPVLVVRGASPAA
jgi:uncharacterized protein (TIGR03435 family)